MLWGRGGRALEFGTRHQVSLMGLLRTTGGWVCSKPRALAVTEGLTGRGCTRVEAKVGREGVGWGGEERKGGRGKGGRAHLSVSERDVILMTTNLTAPEGEVKIYRVSEGLHAK